MRIGRTIPPAAAPIPWKNIFGTAQAIVSRRKSDEIKVEGQLKTYFGGKHCFLASSGKAALTLILQTLHHLAPDRSEVVIPAFTCFSVPASIHRAGLRVKLCDTAPDSLDFNRADLQHLFESPERSDNILCIMPTHFYGIPADLKFLRKFAGKNIPIVEDAAQSMGEEANNTKLGISGDIGFFSLGRGKALSCGEGGIIITDRDDIAKILAAEVEKLPKSRRCSMARSAIKAAVTNILLNPHLYWLPKSLPFLHLGETLYEEDFCCETFSPVQRRLAENWQHRLHQLQQARRDNVIFFRGNLPQPFRQLAPDDFGGSMIKMPILAPSGEIRKSILENSESDGLGLMPVYPSPINRINEISDRFRGEHYPNAQSLCDRMFTIPVHPLVSERDRDQIVRLLQNS